MSLLQTTLRALRVSSSKVVSGALVACLQDAWSIYLKMLRKQWLELKEGKHSSMYLQAGKGQDKTAVYTNPTELPALHLAGAKWFDKRHHLFASYVFLQNWFSQFGVTTNNACESTNNAILSERHLAIFDFCCAVNAYINQQFPNQRVKWSHSTEKLSDFALGQHTSTMQQPKNWKSRFKMPGGENVHSCLGKF